MANERKEVLEMACLALSVLVIDFEQVGLKGNGTVSDALKESAWKYLERLPLGERPMPRWGAGRSRPFQCSWRHLERGFKEVGQDLLSRSLCKFGPGHYRENAGDSAFPLPRRCR